MFRATIYYVIYVLVVVGLTLAIVLSFVHKPEIATHPEPRTTTVTPQSPTKPTSPKSIAPKTSVRASAGAAAQNAGNIPAPNPTITSGTSGLANTGPGSVSLVFAVVSASSTLIFWVWQIHQRGQQAV